MTINSGNTALTFGEAGSAAFTEKYLTTVMVENCQASVESVADGLSPDAEEHAMINDCLAACGEYTTAAARESRYQPRYAAWCVERCAEMAAACDRLGDATSRRCARWCRLVMKELNREVVTWEGVKKVMNQEVNWDGVKEVMNKEVQMPWGQ